jgi:hypothetical protein
LRKWYVKAGLTLFSWLMVLIRFPARITYGTSTLVISIRKENQPPGGVIALGGTEKLRPKSTI